MSDPAWALALTLAGLAASTSNGAVGIGGGLLVMPLLALWFPPQQVVAYTVPMFFVSTLVTGWRYRRDIHWRTFFSLTPGVLAGIVVGAHFLSTAPAVIIRAIMGGIALLFGTQEVIRLITHRTLAAPPVWVSVPLTLAAGVASALTNIGGTVVSLAMIGQSMGPRLFVGTLTAVMISMSALKLGLFSVGGLLTWHGAVLAIPSIPASIVGSRMGRWLNGRLSPDVFRWILLAIIMASALLLVLRH